VRRHEQTSGAWQVDGSPFGERHGLQWIAEVTIHSEIGPPKGDDFYPVLKFDGPLGSAPDVQIVTVHGTVSAE